MGMYLPDEEQIEFVRTNLDDATPQLKGALNHDNTDVRQRTAYVIGEIGPEAKSLGPPLAERLKVEPERIVRIYIYDALAAVQFSNFGVVSQLHERYDALSPQNEPYQFGAGYADVDERINVAAALYVLHREGPRDEYLEFVTKWLAPPAADIKPEELGGYWERRWVAVISLEGMPEATEAIPLLESMLDEKDAKSWVNVHVPRVLGVLRHPGG